MAITITKEPNGIYPAYNDSYLEFTSSIINDDRAEIFVDIEGEELIFTVYPDLNGNYLFNYKEVVKTVFNKEGFNDVNYDNGGFWYSISGIYLLQHTKIVVYKNFFSEEIEKDYQFFKAVKQIAEPIHTNPFQLLTYSKGGVSHNLTYWEGFPFHFDILKVNASSEIIVKSLNTGDQTEAMTPITSESFRIITDRSNKNNWTHTSFLPLITGLNRLEIYEDAVFKTNLLLYKKKVCSGIYLKWFNGSGGFSHHLFNEFFTENLKGDDIGRILNDQFNNIDESSGSHKNIGKVSENTIRARTKFNHEEYHVLKSIFLNPSIQMYTSTTAYVEGRFIDVSVEGNISFNNKKASNELTIIINLPESITATL